MAVAVIHDNILYVANVGDSRVILCTYVQSKEADSTAVEFKVDTEIKGMSCFLGGTENVNIKIL